MDLHNSMFSQSTMLSEQMARQVFEIIPEHGPLVAIMDGEGNCWPSDSEKFENLGLSKTWLSDFCSKIDDGAEPLISKVQNYDIVGAQLVSEQNKYGYVFIAIEGPGVESLLSKFELIEVILNQFSLIAGLIEKCNSLYQIQSKLCSSVLKN